MKKQSVTASNKIPFGVSTRETLSLSPNLYTWASITNPEWLAVDTWHGNNFAPPATPEIRSNLYNLKTPYISNSTKLEMTNTETQGIFHLEKKGTEVTYTSENSQGSVHINYSWGIATHLTLQVGNLQHTSESNPVELHEEHGVRHLMAGGEANNTVALEGAKSVVIPDSTYFSFTTNSNMYFSIVDNLTAALHQLLGNTLVKKDESLLQGFAWSGGNFALSNNKNTLYPPGITTLRINDGFSESIAEIEFNRNASDSTVKISVKSHTSRICEIDGSTIVFAL